MACMVYGFSPVVRLIEGLGLAPRLFARVGAGRERQLARRNPFGDYVPGPQDVIVMTYAKSGTNWMMQIGYQLIHHGGGEFEHLHDVVPWPDTTAMPGPMSRYAVPLAEADDWETAPEHKRIIKTHLNWDLIPYSPDARYIAVIRDPKDIFVSSYFFVKDGVLGPMMPSVDTWFELFLTPDFMLGGSWAGNTAGFWAQRDKPNVLLMSFKAMKRDLEGAVRGVAAFLDIHVSDEVIAEVCRRAAFSYMKAHDQQFAIGKMIPWKAPGAMLRKGTQGGSSELLSRERQRAIDAHCQAELKALGSDFPYAEYCTLTP